MNRGAVFQFGGRLPGLYSGVICGSCGLIECADCKKLSGRIDAPCRLCGGPVNPAYETYLKRRAAAEAGSPTKTRISKKSFAIIALSIVSLVILAFPIYHRAVLSKARTAYADTIFKMAQIRRSMSLAGIPWPAAEYDFKTLFEDLDKRGVSLNDSYAIRGRFTNPVLDAWGNAFFFEQSEGVIYLVSHGLNGRPDHKNPLHDKPLPVIKGGDIVLRNWDFIHRPDAISRLPITLPVPEGLWSIPLD